MSPKMHTHNRTMICCSGDIDCHSFLAIIPAFDFDTRQHSRLRSTDIVVLLFVDLEDISRPTIEETISKCIWFSVCILIASVVRQSEMSILDGNQVYCLTLAFTP